MANVCITSVFFFKKANLTSEQMYSFSFIEQDKPRRDGDFLCFKPVEDHVSTKHKKTAINHLLPSSFLYEVGEQAHALASYRLESSKLINLFESCFPSVK